MKKRVALFAGLAALVIGTLLPGVALAQGQGKNDVFSYVAIGDSITFGDGASSPATTGNTALFHAYLDGKPDVSLVNLAQPGATSGSVLSGQLASALAVINDNKTNVTTVSLQVGGDDLLVPLQPGGPCSEDPGSEECAAAFATALESFANNYIATLATLQSALAKDPGKETLLVQTVYNPFDGPLAALKPIGDLSLLGFDGTVDCAANQQDPYNVGLNDLIVCIGGAFGATIVDVFPIFDGNALSLTHIAIGDGNPNDAGHAAIANATIAAYAAVNNP
ncbi:MAG: SGNH/GDSL hydrolase family protein [SAR202 cluster bacterium]|nr:SGNH/GDSL hydrolase family protein [SAR202 cluster bacterium]